jgi:hypothetical protein
VGKYGTNLEGFGGFEGGVNADKGAPLVSTSSDGETSQLFGQAALREIQAGVANGDFAIPPDAAGDTITAENPLPYWTFTDTSSAGSITCAVVADGTAGSGNVLRWSVAANTTTGKAATITRFVPIPSSKDQAYAALPELAIGGATSTALRVMTLTMQYFQQDQVTATGTAVSKLKPFSSAITTKNIWFDTTLTRLNAPSDAAFIKLTIEVSTTGTFASVATIDLYEVKMNIATPVSLVSERVQPSTYGPGGMWKQYGSLFLGANPPTLDTLDGGADVQIYDGGAYVYGFFGADEATSFPGNALSQYDKGGSSDSTTITTAGTYYALTNAEVSFSPQFTGQRWLLTFTGYASLNTTTIQYCFVRANVVTTANVNIVDLGFSRADNFGTSGRGATVAFTKVYTADAADVTAGTRKFKLYGTVQTTNGLNLSLAYTQMTAYPIG